MIRPVWCILLGIAVLVPPSPAKAESAADLTVDLAQLATDRNAGALVEVRVADRDLVLSVDGHNVAQRAVDELGRVTIFGSPGNDRLKVDVVIESAEFEPSELEIVFDAGDGDDRVDVRGLPTGGRLEIRGGAGDDWVSVYSGGASVSGQIVYDGESERTLDGLSVIAAAAGESVRYSPDPAIFGAGRIDLDRCQILFVDLEPVDVSGFATATFAPPGTDDLLTVTAGFDSATGTIPALVVGGTTGGIPVEILHAFNNVTLVIDTTSIDGNDTLTVSSANNAHANANLQLTTGSGTDLIDITGPAVTTGNQVYSGPTDVGADLTAASLSFDNTVTPSGIRAVAGNLVLGSGSDLTLSISGTTAGAGYPQFDVTGTVSISGALTANVTFTPANGDTFTLIGNDSTDAVIGTFSGLPEGALVATIGSIDVSISYFGGDGNDVVLSAVLVPVELMRFTIE